jgi:hypothetical protein
MNERELFEKAIRENLAPDHADDALEMEGDYYAEYATSLAWSMWREGRRFAPTEGAVAWPVPLSIETNYEVGQTVELIFESDEDAETFSRLYGEYMGDAAPSQPAVDALCSHRIADVRNEVVKSGYMCLDCGALFAAADHASEPKALTLTDEQRDALEWAVRHLSGYGRGVWPNSDSLMVKRGRALQALLADRGSEGGDVLQSAADLLSDLGYSKQADVVRNVIADRAQESNHE